MACSHNGKTKIKTKRIERSEIVCLKGKDI